MHRLFVSLNLPKSVRDSLSREILELKNGAWAEVEFMPRENWHFTLAFLGNQDDLAVGEIIRALNEIAPKIKAPEIIVESLCYGPKIENPSMIWALADKTSSLKLFEIQKKLNDALAKVNIRFQEDKKTFNGHITLARFKGKKGYPSLNKTMNAKFIAYDISLKSEDATLCSWTLDEE